MNEIEAQAYQDALALIRESIRSKSTELKIEHKNLSGLPAEIGAHSYLLRLDLSWCGRLRDVSSLTSLMALQSLNLERCDESMDLKVLAGLTALQTLDLSNFLRLGDLKVLAGLTALQTLRLSGCRTLSDLSALAGLTALQTLDLTGCAYFRNLDVLAGLTALQTLKVSWCSGLNDISALAGLTALKNLILSRCDKISSIGILRNLFEHLDTLYIEGCSLADVPEALCAPRAGHVAAEVRAHFVAQEQQGKTEHRECKVLLLGNGQAGKTQLARYFRNERFDEKWDSTHGIHFCEAERTIQMERARASVSRPVRLNVWDFGGQDLYHHTHRVFFQADAIYLILWDAFAPTEGQPLSSEPGEHRLDRPHPLTYWLDQVFSLGSQGKQPPQVLIVRSKADDDRGRSFEPWQSQVPEAYHDIVDYVEISLREKTTYRKGLTALENWLKGAITKELGPPERAYIGIGRAAVIQTLRQRQARVTRAMEQAASPDRATSRPEREDTWLSREEFDEVARDCIAQATDSEDSEQIEDYRDATALLQTLHRMGVVRYKAGTLGDRVIIDQRWVAEGIYTLFRRADCYKKLQGADGVFTHGDLRAWAWNDSGYTEDEQAVFLEFMVDCRICFQLLSAQEAARGDTVYVVPACLPEPDQAGFIPPRIAEGIREIMAAGGPRQCVISVENQFLSETSIQSLLHRIGTLFGRSATLWKWGAAFRTVGRYDRPDIQAGAAKIEWRESRPGSYGGKLTITLHARETTGALELFKKIRQEIYDLPAFPDLMAESWRFEELPPDASPGTSGDSAGEPAEPLAAPPTDEPKPGSPEAAQSGLQDSVGVRTPKTISISYAGKPEHHKEAVHKLSMTLRRVTRGARRTGLPDH